MAGSRLERIGSIFSRATGLLRSEVIKYDDRPIWYDVYRVFPPTLEPHFDREPVLLEGVTEEVPEIFYEEDTARAVFYSLYGKNPGGIIRKLGAVEGDDPAGPFISRYTEVAKEHPDWTQHEIIDAIAAEFSFRRESRKDTRVRSATATVTPPTTSNVNVSDMLDGDDDTPAPSMPPRKSVLLNADTLLSMFKDQVGTKKTEEPPKS